MKAGEIIASKYRLKGRLGIGGMGEVWSAEHVTTEREFAIKFMHSHLATSQGSRQRFTREARASARINHPNIIDVFDVGEIEEGGLYLVMELLDGISLDDAFYAAPRLSVRDLIAVMVDTVKALAAAHAVDIVHRDVKPGNIYLHRERTTGLATAKVLDFGISKFSAANDGTKATNNSSILGSPRYMSPEQTRSAAGVDARADIWSAGVVLFQGLTGHWPHEGDSFSSLVVAIATKPARSIDEFAPHLPAELRAIVQGCLAPIDERIQTAAELAAELEHILGDGDLAAIPLPAQHDVDEASHHSVTTGGLRVKTPPPLTGSGSRGSLAGIQDVGAGPAQGGGARALASLTPSKVVPPAPESGRGGAPAVTFSGIIDAETTTQGPPSSDASSAVTDPLPQRRPPLPPMAPAGSPAMQTQPIAFSGVPLAPPGAHGPAAVAPGGDRLTASVSTMNVETLAITGPNDLTTSRPSGPAPPLQPPISLAPPFRSNQSGVLGLVAIMLGVAAVAIGALVFSAVRAPTGAEVGAASVTSQAAPQPVPQPVPTETQAAPEPVAPATSAAAAATSSASVAPPSAPILPGPAKTNRQPPRAPPPPPPRPSTKKKTIEGLGSGL